MQKYTEIAENQTLKESRELLLNNDKTALSNSSGTSFPTQNVQIGQFCFRMDEATLYQCTDKNTWTKLVTFTGGLPMFHNVPNYDAATPSKLGLVKIGSNITNQNGTISITDENVKNALGYKPPTANTATQNTNGLMTATDKTKLDTVAPHANDYSLPAASKSVRGGVKIGSNISFSGDTISITKENVTSALGYTPPDNGVVNASKNGLMTPAMLALLNTVNNAGDIETASIAENGYIKFKKGIILQWGRYTESYQGAREAWANYPVTFPHKCFAAVIGGYEYEQGIIYNNGTLHVESSKYDEPVGGTYLAIGY